MPTNLHAASSYVDAINAGDIEAALVHVAEDAEMVTPIGTKRGKVQIRGMLQMLAKLPAGEPMPPPTEESGEVVTRSRSPMGNARLTFQVADDLIRHIAIRLGE